MAEESPREPRLAADPPDDVLGKIDQLLNRHRPKASDAGTVPVLTDAPERDDTAPGDGIPVLTDVVAVPARPASTVSSRSHSINSVLVLRRMALALEAEHARLLAQTGGDPAQAHMLGRLVAELKRALPAVVRAAIADKIPDPARPDDDGRL